MGTDVPGSLCFEHALDSIEEDVIDVDAKLTRTLNGEDTSVDIDANLTFSEPATPTCTRQMTAFNANSTNPTLSPEPTFGASPDFDFLKGTSLLFDDLGCSPHNISRIRSHVRRSISEPPDGLSHELSIPRPPPPMTFHRGGHFIGKKIQADIMQLKSMPKNKNPTPHPYARRRQPQQRHQLRRLKTETAHLPTSVPAKSTPRPSIQFEELPFDHAQYSSSRVCTPSAPPVASKEPIDTIMNPTDIVAIQGNQHDSKIVSSSVTTNELRAIVFDAVQEAIKDWVNPSIPVVANCSEQDTA